MEFKEDKSRNQSEKQVRNLLQQIQNTTIIMSNTFEQAILRHQEQFLKTYRIKISQLIKLFQTLTTLLEDKFISNALSNRLEIVGKERDYFKYECLKLNVQYQTAIEDQKNLNAQIVNITEQMQIYKHLLEQEKLKSSEIQKSNLKIKNNFHSLAYNTLNQNNFIKHKITDDNELTYKKELENVKLQLKKKNETIRGLKGKVNEYESFLSQKEDIVEQKKELYETFRSCVNSWKRQILTKERHHNSLRNREEWDIEKVNALSKKQLLKSLFTSKQFLELIDDLLFNPKISITFKQNKEKEDKYMLENRKKLIEFMRKKKIIAYVR